ncbi:cation-translocating P-type ATPase [Cognatilysobacter segetis]|uniref:cation-translocating P-type ATPase n=1 Tax=Cognatilysobacter segetis TaxID=2492394 RepID=UPI00105F32DC|nr:HAD-IC family P-type ATPase [Lysobacter segetis]
MPQSDATDSLPRGPRGLSTAEAAARLLRDGPNTLDVRRRAPVRAVLSVLTEPMLLLLAAAAALYAGIGEWLDASAMIASVAFVVLLNVYQNLRSERALDALRELTAPKARVLRDGAVQTVPAATLVAGDLLLVAQGDRIAADARLLDGSSLEVDESLLTGESVPVRKDEQASSLYAGTFVVQGEGTAEVVATGPRSEFGRLGGSLATVRRASSPLRQQIGRLVRLFAPLSLGGAAVLAALALARGTEWREALLSGLTLAMATVPEEFPVILSVMFALGGWRLARANALVQRPDAIETLGCMSVLCTDKTGTLTENRMRVEQVLVRDATSTHRAAEGVARDAVLAAAARACPDRPVDPMDIAVLEAAGVETTRRPLERFYPFSNALHATAGIAGDGAAREVCIKGAPEAVAGLCGFDAAQQASLEHDIATLAASGFRVLAVARCNLRDAPYPDDLRGLRFDWLGLLALADPLRVDVPAAVQRARGAGIRVLLVTGDHPVTARAIAKAAGIAADGEVLSGADIAAATPAELLALSRRCNVYARVRPADKLKLVQCLVDAGDVVGMTGDGINDAPALAAAHVGIAMGRRGSDVARHAASVVLADDRFASIVDAVGLGRAIYANLLRAVQYVTAVHVPIAGAALLPVLFSLPPVLLPVHVVLLELLIDPASTLVFERRGGDPAAMQQPPRPIRASLVTWSLGRPAAALGLAALVGALMGYGIAMRVGLDPGALYAYAFLSILGGNLATLAVTAWPADGGAGDLRPIVIAVLAATVVVVTAALVPATARLLHLEALVPAHALVAAALPAIAVLATGRVLHRRKHAVS